MATQSHRSNERAWRELHDSGTAGIAPPCAGTPSVLCDSRRANGTRVFMSSRLTVSVRAVRSGIRMMLLLVLFALSMAIAPSAAAQGPVQVDCSQAPYNGV